MFFCTACNSIKKNNKASHFIKSNSDVFQYQKSSYINTSSKNQKHNFQFMKKHLQTLIVKHKNLKHQFSLLESQLKSLIKKQKILLKQLKLNKKLLKFKNSDKNIKLKG